MPWLIGVGGLGSSRPNKSAICIMEIVCCSASLGLAKYYHRVVRGTSCSPQPQSPGHWVLYNCMALKATRLNSPAAFIRFQPYLLYKCIYISYVRRFTHSLRNWHTQRERWSRSPMRRKFHWLTESTGRKIVMDLVSTKIEGEILHFIFLKYFYIYFP